MIKQRTEVERVDEIHTMLLTLVERASGRLCNEAFVLVAGVTHRYTHEELRKFRDLLPSMRAALQHSDIAWATESPDDGGAAYCSGPLESYANPAAFTYVNGYPTSDLVTRGLYLTKEHVQYQRAIQKVEVKVDTATARQPAKVDAYPRDFHTLTDAEISQLMATSDKATGKRKRLIAALKAELGRPLPRKPSKHDPRPFDLEQAWSTPGDES